MLQLNTVSLARHAFAVMPFLEACSGSWNH